MRKKDREITDINKIENIISRCHCCRLGFCDNGHAYIVPMNFGYVNDNGKYTFYFHSANEGRKIDLIKENPHAGFELDTNFELNEGDEACDYSARFQSVIGNGVISFVNGFEEKKTGLNLIMEHYTGKKEWTYDEKMINAVCIFKLEINELSCKEHL